MHMFSRRLRNVINFFQHQKIQRKYVHAPPVQIPTVFKIVNSYFAQPKTRQFVLLWIPTVTTVHTFGWSKEKAGPDLRKLDSLFDENKFEQIVQELTPYKDKGNVEVLWRLARALYKISKTTSDDKVKHKLIVEGLELAEKSLSMGSNVSPVHKWYSILLDAKSHYDGLKARITVTEKVKFHWLKAVELDPKDATTLYLLGLWCFEVTALPWYQRKIAATIFATPPTSSYEEALQFCERAEKVSPNFYSCNLLLLGKIYDQLGKRDTAVGYLRRARDYPPKTEDDKASNKEAADLLKAWGVKN